MKVFSTIGQRWAGFKTRLSNNQTVSKGITLYRSMSPRDQRLFIGLIVAILVGVVALGFISGRRYIHRLNEDIARKEQQLQRLVDVRSDYVQLKSRIEALEEKMGKGEDFSLTAFLERSANGIGFSEPVNIQSRGETANEGFTETLVDVKIRKAALDQIIRYLFAVETAPQQLRIKSVRLKTTFRSRELLDAEIEVVQLIPREA